MLKGSFMTCPSLDRDSLTYVPLLHSTYSSHSVNCISTVSHHWTTQSDSYYCSHLQCSSFVSRRKLALHPCNPGVLLPTVLLVLENGHLFLGMDSCDSWRVWEEDHHSSNRTDMLSGRRKNKSLFYTSQVLE